MRGDDLKVFQRNIVNGQTTNLWFDPWINGANLLNKLGSQARINMRGYNLKVYNIINNNLWQLN